MQKCNYTYSLSLSRYLSSRTSCGCIPTRKTERGTNLSIIEEAAREVENGMSVRAAGKKYGVDRMTLTRYVAKGGGSGYQGTAAAHKVFDADMEQELAHHVKTPQTNSTG